VAEDPSFARLVSLACHDLRTPLATVHGFARTLVRMDGVDEQMSRYLGMIDAASQQLAALLDDLGLAARIESGRYEPTLRSASTGELAESAASAAGEGAAAVGADDTTVHVDPDAVSRSLAAFARCAIRHGGVEHVELRADGETVAVSPVPEPALPIVLGRNLQDLGSAVGVRVVAAHGGTIEPAGETLVVRLPRGPTAQAAT
jgi:signal transduction histidine kinase